MVIALATTAVFSCSASAQSVVNSYLNNFVQKERQLFLGLASTRQLNASEWEAFKKEQYPLYLKAESERKNSLKSKYSQSINPKIYHDFNKALHSAGMKNIELISVGDTSTDMWAMTTAVCVNESVVQRTHADDNEIIASFLHELGHIQHRDDFHKYCLNALRKYTITDVQQWNDLLYQWSHLREERADLTAVSAGYIDGRISFFARNNFPASDTHPSAQNHTAYLISLKNQL